MQIQDLCKGGGQPRFCRHRAAESRQRQKFGPQNGGSGGGAQAPRPPLDPHLGGSVQECTDPVSVSHVLISGCDLDILRKLIRSLQTVGIVKISE